MFMLTHLQYPNVIRYKLYFFKSRHLVNCFDLCKIEAKKVGGVTLLLKLKLNEFHFYKQYCQVFIMDKYFIES